MIVVPYRESKLTRLLQNALGLMGGRRLPECCLDFSAESRWLEQDHHDLCAFACILEL